MSKTHILLLVFLVVLEYVRRFWEVHDDHNGFCIDVSSQNRGLDMQGLGRVAHLSKCVLHN